MLEKAGGQVIAGAEVTRVVVSSGRAVAVMTRGGDEFPVERGIIANVTPRNLFGKLVSPEDMDSRFFQRAQQYRYGPGTFIIHLALDRMPAWQAADDLGAFNYIHLNGSETEIENTYRQCLAIICLRGRFWSSVDNAA